MRRLHILCTLLVLAPYRANKKGTIRHVLIAQNRKMILTEMGHTPIEYIHKLYRTTPTLTRCARFSRKTIADCRLFIATQIWTKDSIPLDGQMLYGKRFLRSLSEEIVYYLRTLILYQCSANIRTSL